MKKTASALLIVFVLAFYACNKEQYKSINTGKEKSAASSFLASISLGFPENFETGSKTAYATGNVTLHTGSWTFDDALLGNLSTDAKNGSQSARIRNTGMLQMNFDVTNGAGTVTLNHAVFGTDGGSTWELWNSINGGSSWSKTGSTVTSSSTTLQNVSFTVNVQGNIRFQVRKVSGGTNRINIDDFTINDFGSSGGGGTPTGKKFLFDATKAETAGNADWVIDEDNSTPQRVPTPAQSIITSTTQETYWTGALSAWGIALVQLGNSVETLPSGAAISYGNASNPQDLSNYDVYVVDEPNILFTSTEKIAILNFINHGGGLMMISDHTVSDRNNDGYDSPAIWNDLMQNNSVKNNPFGFSIDLTNITETTSNVTTVSNPVTNGSQGNVTQLEFNNGATVTINPSVNTAVKGLIWQSTASQGTTKIMCASSTYGSGRVVVITDSSPADDGTGAPNNTLFGGWTEVNGNHTRLHLNSSLWLAKLQ